MAGLYQKPLAQELLHHIDLEHVEHNKFILEPFLREIGILVAKDVKHEDDARIQLGSYILFPDSYLDSSVDPAKNHVKRIQELCDMS